MKNSRRFRFLACAGFALMIQACSSDDTSSTSNSTGSGGGPTGSSSSSGGIVGSSSSSSSTSGTGGAGGTGGGAGTGGIGGGTGGTGGIGITELLVGHSFDVADPEIADFSGNGHTGSLSGSRWIAGPVGNAISLDGFSGNVILPATGITDGLNDFSVSTWVNPTRLATWMRIFDFGTGTNQYMTLIASAGGTGRPRFSIKNGGPEQVVDSSIALVPDTWQHIAVTQSGDTVSLYINGTLVGSNPAVTLRASLFSATQSWIGRSQYSADPHFEGAHDDFRLYNRALTVDELTALAVHDVVSADGLLADYLFDETAGLVAADSSGNARDGQIVDNGISWGPGRIDGAIQLDGTAGYVKMPVDIFSGISDFSFALWVNLDNVRTWSQLVDFGNDTNTYLALIANAGGTNTLRFTLKVNGGAEEIVNGVPLPVGSWQHVAVTRAGTRVSIYLNGAVVGSGTVLRTLPNGGATRNNWLGRSQWPDPLVDGALDDFRLYTGALSAADIAELAR